MLCNSDDDRRVSNTRIYGNKRRTSCGSWIVIKSAMLYWMLSDARFIHTSSKGGVHNHVGRSYCRLASLGPQYFDIEIATKW